MTHIERVAIQRALETADFSRSPGLPRRMRHSLGHPSESDLLPLLVLVVIGLGFCWVICG